MGALGLFPHRDPQVQRAIGLFIVLLVQQERDRKILPRLGQGEGIRLFPGPSMAQLWAGNPYRALAFPVLNAILHLGVLVVEDIQCDGDRRIHGYFRWMSAEFLI